MGPYRAIIAGATGAVGGALVRELLASPKCAGVTALVRRAVGSFDAHPMRSKLSLCVIDFSELEVATAREAAGHGVAFCTVGIGQPRKVSAEEFHRVDIEYAGAFARGCAASGVRHISLLSSVGANAESGNRYLRVKGEAERAVSSAGIAEVSLFRPSLLVTQDIRYGLQDRLTQSLFPLVAPLLPKKYHQIRVEDLARAMRVNAEREVPIALVHYQDMLLLLED